MENSAPQFPEEPGSAKSPMSIEDLPIAEDSRSVHHDLSTTLSICAMPITLLTWAFAPNFAAKLLATAISIPCVIHLSYRSHFVREFSSKQKRAVAFAAVVALLGGASFLLIPQWRDEHLKSQRQKQPAVSPRVVSIPALTMKSPEGIPAPPDLSISKQRQHSEPAAARFSPAPTVVQEAPSYGNLKAQANELADDIMKNLCEDGWRNQGCGSITAMGNIPETSEGSLQWIKLQSKIFHNKMLPRVIELKDDFAKLNFKDLQLDQEIDQIQDNDKMKDDFQGQPIPNSSMWDIQPQEIADIADRLRVLGDQVIGP